MFAGVSQPVTPEYLFETLTAAISTESSIRAPAEQALGKLCGKPGYMSSLLAVIGHDQVTPPIR